MPKSKLSGSPSYFNYRGAALVDSDYSVMLELQQVLGRRVPHIFDECEINSSPSSEELKAMHEKVDIEEFQGAWDEWYGEFRWQGKGLHHHNFAFITNEGYVTGLALTHAHLQEIPPPLFNLRRLSKLYLDGNNISRIPKDIKDLTCLTELCLESNPVSDLPEEITHLPKLSHLGLLDTAFTALPTILLRFPALRHIDLNLPLPKNDVVFLGLHEKKIKITAKFGWNYSPTLPELKEAVLDYVKEHPDFGKEGLTAALNISYKDEGRAIRELIREGKISDGE